MNLSKPLSATVRLLHFLLLQGRRHMPRQQCRISGRPRVARTRGIAGAACAFDPATTRNEEGGLERSAASKDSFRTIRHQSGIFADWNVASFWRHHDNSEAILKRQVNPNRAVPLNRSPHLQKPYHIRKWTSKDFQVRSSPESRATNLRWKVREDPLPAGAHVR